MRGAPYIRPLLANVWVNAKVASRVFDLQDGNDVRQFFELALGLGAKSVKRESKPYRGWSVYPHIAQETKSRDVWGTPLSYYCGVKQELCGPPAHKTEIKSYRR